MEVLARVEKRLGVKFKKPALLVEALTHCSFLNEHRDWTTPHNERLELLGDAVIELVVTEYLFRTFLEKREGEITALRSALVNTVMLGEVGGQLQLHEYLLLSRGEEKALLKKGSRTFSRLIASAFEAVVGALYLDQGYESVQEFLGRVLLPQLVRVLAEEKHRDSKSVLQEEAQGRQGITPSYRILNETGSEHTRHFVVGVYFGERFVGRGEGGSKKQAEQDGAGKVLRRLRWWIPPAS